MAAEDPLNPTPDEIRDAGRSAIELMAEYLGSIRDRHVYPNVTSSEIREQLDRELPQEAQPLELDRGRRRTPRGEVCI